MRVSPNQLLTLMLLLLLLEGLFGGQNGPGPRPVRQIKCPAAELLLSRGDTILLVIVYRGGFLFTVHRWRMGAMALRRRIGQGIEPTTTAAAAYPLILNIKLFSELTENVIYLIVNGGRRWRPAGLLDYRRSNLVLFAVIVIILVLGQMTEVRTAGAEAGPTPTCGGLGFSGGQEAVVEFADDPIKDVQTAPYIIAEKEI